jgi:hypothetical protein
MVWQLSQVNRNATPSPRDEALRQIRRASLSSPPNPSTTVLAAGDAGSAHRAVSRSRWSVARLQQGQVNSSNFVTSACLR